MPTLSSNIVKLEVASVRDVEEALARQALYGGDLATNLLELSSVSEEQLTRVIASSLELEPAPSGELPVSPERVRRFVPKDVAQRYVLYPLEESAGTLTVAVSEPLSPEVASDLEFSLGLGLSQRATTRIRVEQAIARDYGTKLDQRVERVLAHLAGKPDPHPTGPPEFSNEDAPLQVQAPEPRIPRSYALESEASDSRASEPHGAESNASDFYAAESHSPESSVAESNAPESNAAESHSPESSVAESSAPEFDAADSHASESRGFSHSELEEHASEATEVPSPEGSLTASSTVKGLAEPEPTSSIGKPARPIPKLALAALARAEKPPLRRRRRLGPYTAAMAERDLIDAESRDEVVAAFFDFAAQYFDYSALFQVHGELAEGRDAQGTGAPRNKVRGIGVPLELPSTLASAISGESYRLARLSASGLDGALLKDLDRRPGPAVLLLPVRVRGRSVLVLYGDHGDSDVELGAVGNVIAFTPLVASALERLILRRKGQPRDERLAPGNAMRPVKAKPERQPLPSKIARAEALAQALEVMPQRESDAAQQAIAPAAYSVPPYARPVISVGPRRKTTPRGVSARPGPAEAAPPSSIPPGSTLVQLPTQWGPPLPSRFRTPIPSSLAPGAPPHEPVLSPSRVGIEADAPDENWDAVAPVRRFALNEPRTKPGVGSEPPRTSTGSFRSETPRALVPPELVDDEAWDAIVPGDGSADELDDTSLDLRSGAHGTSELAVGISGLDEPLDEAGEEEPTIPGGGSPFAPLSRSLAYSARPLPMPRSSMELRLPTVIVDLAHDTEDLVARVIGGDQRAAERLVEIGAAAVPALVGAFPGPITNELRRTIGDAAPRASDAGPLLKVLARIGARAAGVLSVRSNDKDPNVRAWATRLLGEMPCLDAARAVARRFIDDDVEVRRSALAAARLLQASPGSAEVLAGALSEMLLDAARQDRLQHMVIEAVADLREARAIPALATLLVSGSKEIQRSAHWALIVLTRTDFGDDGAAWEEWWRVNLSRHRIEWLIDALMQENQEIRRTAGDELKSLTKEYFGYYDDLPPRERERAQQRYREWWQSKGKARFS